MPAATEGRFIRVGWRTTLSALVRAKLPWAGRAGQCRQLSEEDVGTQSGEESQHHRLGHESDITTETHHPATSIDAPAIKVSQIRASER